MTTMVTPAAEHVILGAVATELERLRPHVTAQLRRQAARSCTAHGCGPQLLQLSYRASARRKLRALVRAAPISIRELADVIGVEYKTLVNHLAGRPMAQRRRDWYHAVNRIEVHGHEVHVIVRYRPTRKRWGWKLTREQKRAVLSGQIDIREVEIVL